MAFYHFRRLIIVNDYFFFANLAVFQLGHVGYDSRLFNIINSTAKKLIRLILNLTPDPPPHYFRGGGLNSKILYYFSMKEPRSITINARRLRKGATEAEQILWKKLRNNQLGLKFRRQHPFEMFIVDFYAPSVKLVIELDGSIHTIPANKDYDEMRTDYLKLKQVYILRFWNSEVEKDIEAVISKIKETIKQLTD